MKISPKDSLEKIIDNLWITLRRGAADSKHAFHFCYLATVGEGPLSVRTVILRMVEDQQLWVYTDHRSAKVRQLKKHPEASILFYDHRRKLQVQALSRGAVFHRDRVAKKHFEDLHAGNLKDYQGVVGPGERLDLSTGQSYDPDLEDKYFCALAFDVMRFDVLQLHKEGHIRCGFKRAGNSWQGQWLAP